MVSVSEKHPRYQGVISMTKTKKEFSGFNYTPKNKSLHKKKLKKRNYFIVKLE